MPTTHDLTAIRERAAAHERELTERQYAGVPDLARRWGVSDETVRNIPADALPFSVFGRGRERVRRRYKWADVERYERAARRGGGGATAPGEDSAA